jgi:hypothetical protein
MRISLYTVLLLHGWHDEEAGQICRAYTKALEKEGAGREMAVYWIGDKIVLTNS